MHMNGWEAARGVTQVLKLPLQGGGVAEGKKDPSGSPKGRELVLRSAFNWLWGPRQT